MPFFIQLLAFFGVYLSFTTSVTYLVTLGNNCQNCPNESAESNFQDVLTPAIGDCKNCIIKHDGSVLTPAIDDCKNCKKFTNNNGQLLTSVVNEGKESLRSDALMTVLVTSDGTQARPYCTWASVCQYDSSIETLCASKLCEASGMAYDSSTVFVSSSGSMCVYNIVNGNAYYYVVDLGYYTYADPYLESAITASCVMTSFPSISPTELPTTVIPSINPAPTSGILITSDGTQARPYCTWNSNPCQYDSSIETLCASKLCEASGLVYDPSTVFVSSSGNMCESGNDIVSGGAYYYVVSTGNFEYSDYILESAITARCGDSSSLTSIQPSQYPTPISTIRKPTVRPSTRSPSSKPTSNPSFRPTRNPPTTRKPTSKSPTVKPTLAPSRRQTRAPSRRPGSPTTANPTTSGILVTSDGTQARPYCSWSNVCQYDSSIETLCASKLCEASGLTYDPSTVFVSSSGSMCVYDIYQGGAYYYLVDLVLFTYGEYYLESAITARCGAFTSIQPSQYPTTARKPTIRPSTRSPSRRPSRPRRPSRTQSV